MADGFAVWAARRREAAAHGYLSEDKFRRRATILHFDSDQRFDWPTVVKGVFGRLV